MVAAIGLARASESPPADDRGRGARKDRQASSAKMQRPSLSSTRWSLSSNMQGRGTTDSEVICDTLDMPRHDPAGVATSVKAHRRLRRSACDLYAVPVEDCEEETEKVKPSRLHRGRSRKSRSGFPPSSTPCARGSVDRARPTATRRRLSPPSVYHRRGRFLIHAMPPKKKPKQEPKASGSEVSALQEDDAFVVQHLPSSLHRLPFVDVPVSRSFSGICRFSDSTGRMWTTRRRRRHSRPR